MHRILIALFTWGTLCIQVHALQEAPALGELQRVKGTRLSLRVPDGFIPAPNFAGYLNLESGSSLMVMEMAAPYPEVVLGMQDPETHATQGLKLIEVLQRPLDGFPGKLMNFEQRINGMQLKKWIWIFGDQANSIMVMGVCNFESEEQDFQRLGEAVRSSQWDPSLKDGPLEEPPFRLEDTGGMLELPLVTGLRGYSNDGLIDQDGAEGKPIFLVSGSMAPTPTEPKKFANRRLRMSPGYRRVRPGDFEEVQIDGLRGYACLATAIHKKSGEPAILYQVMLFQGSTNWLLHGAARQRDQAKYLPIFTRMAKSFRRDQEQLLSSDGLTQLEVPKSWTLRSELNAEADHQAGHVLASNFMIVLTEPKADFDADYDYQQHALATSGWIAAEAKPEGEARSFELHGRPAVRRVFRANSEENPFAYLHVVVDGKQHLHQLIFWCDDQSMQYSLPDFERILQSFQERQ